ncbi:MAG: response regulator transcription factor [Oliverpabstia sp.]
MNRILLLEDEINLNKGISLTLQKAGYQVTSAFSLFEAESYLEKENFALIICDITLPDGSGLELGKKVRERSDTYFMYLTALDSEIDIVNGYDTGADDYITKPFSLMVLVSKVNALMRRIDRKEESGNILICGDLEVNCQEMKVRKDGREIPLSKKELQLLVYLWENAGRVVSKENILEHIWDVDGQFVDDNTVTVNISRLKNKLGTDEISNVRGLGYIWTGKVIKK